MAYIDYGKTFICPKCSSIGSIFLVKFAGKKLVIKQRCPNHGANTIQIPLSQREYIIPHISNAVFRCYKCGQESPVDIIKESGAMVLIKLDCPTHGNKLPFHKIWIGVYRQITSQTTPEIHPTEPKPLEPEILQNNDYKYCPNCGSSLEGKEKFCSTCGSKID